MGCTETCVFYGEEGKKKQMVEHISRRGSVWGKQGDQKEVGKRMRKNKEGWIKTKCMMNMYKML